MQNFEHGYRYPAPIEAIIEARNGSLQTHRGDVLLTGTKGFCSHKNKVCFFGKLLPA
jgi:hypothetical protein